MTLFPEIDKGKTKKRLRGLLLCYRSMVKLVGEEHTPRSLIPVVLN